jgi:hypothetical protein
MVVLLRRLAAGLLVVAASWSLGCGSSTAGKDGAADKPNAADGAGATPDISSIDAPTSDAEDSTPVDRASDDVASDGSSEAGDAAPSPTPACASGTSRPCMVNDGTACLIGSQACVDGVFQACSGGSPSTSAARCGAACGACAPVGDACVDGRCRCGAGDPCTGKKGICCGAAGGSECVDTQSDARFCGSCQTPCDADRAHVLPACTGGTCSYPCAAGWARCPVGVNTKGCETHTDEDAVNCGGCGNACPATVAHAVAAAPACVAGKCAIVCDAGWKDCDGDRGDGCEVDVTTITNCGTCGTTCPAATGGGAACNQGHCELTCPAGFNLCGTTCISNDDVDNCGGCGHACVLPTNAKAFVCTAGKCAVNGCKGNFADCNGLFDDGCESNTQSDGANCGACKSKCPSGRSCTSGSCCQKCFNGTSCCGTSFCFTDDGNTYTCH